MIGLGGALRILRTVFVGSVSPQVMPTRAADVIYATWFCSPFRVPAFIRRVFGGWAESLRRTGEVRRVTTGRFGEVLYRQRVVARIVIGVIGAAVILFARPLESGVIIWTAVVALVLVGVLELLQRPVITMTERAEEDTPVVVG